jgi:hypothetical protein
VLNDLDGTDVWHQRWCAAEIMAEAEQKRGSFMRWSATKSGRKGGA